MVFLVVAPLCLAALVSARGGEAPLRYPVEPRQMLLVITPDWNAVSGELQRFELEDQTWRRVGPPIHIVVGRNGLGWGIGLHPLPQLGPQKREGDGKSPAGVFALESAFGYEPPEKMRILKLPYVQCTSSLECVDDSNSAYYNQVLDRKSVPKPNWHSAEHMRMTNGQYRLGVVVSHNTDPARPGDGSCIFLHIWTGPATGTSGCTAMREGDIEALASWLDLRANPVLVQLPQKEYDRLRTAWRLPEMVCLSAIEHTK
ncbi:MAG TPA: L,D-transpeptidase family protein [Candidatus Saccharimonadales bacterium]|nr:L,D-transpeptidase family protein [Candidatus Saccharimonadales bacterium]